jgi:hypothetical protein
MNGEVIDLTMDDMPVSNLKLSFELVGDELVEMDNEDSDVDTEIDEEEEEEANMFIIPGILNRTPFHRQNGYRIYPHDMPHGYFPFRYANAPQLADRFPYQQYPDLRSRLNRTPVNLEDIQHKNTNCPICFTETEMKSRGVTNCSHAFCIPCLNHWEDQQIAGGKPFTCPCCRDPIDKVSVNYASN